MSKKTMLLICMFVLLYTPISGFQNSAACQMKIGVASVDITPKESIMLVGYAARTEPSKGVVHPIYAKAMAFEDTTGNIAVLVATDLIGFSRNLSDEIVNRAEQELGLPRKCLMLTSSHTHTAPLLYKSKLNMYDLSEQQIETIAAYTEELKENLFQVIQKALAKLAPLNLSFGQGEALLGINRR
jgi:neutral ceramidase